MCSWRPLCAGRLRDLFVVPEQPDTSLPLLTSQVTQKARSCKTLKPIMTSGSVATTSMYFDAEKLIQDMITGGRATDIYWISVSTGCLSVLIQRYYVPWTPTTTRWFPAWTPWTRSYRCSSRMDIIGIPKTTTAHMLCINTGSWKGLA